MLATALNLGTTANILCEMFNTTSKTKIVKDWMSGNCNLFPKTFKSLPDIYAAKEAVTYLQFLDTLYKDHFGGVVTPNQFVCTAYETYGKFTQGLHDLVLGLFLIKHFKTLVLLNTKYEVEENKKSLLYLLFVLYYTGYFTSNSILIINRLHPELVCYSALAENIINVGTEATIDILKEYLIIEMSTASEADDYNFYAIVQLLYKLEVYDSDSYSLKRFLYQIIVTSHYINANTLSFGYIILLSISERKSRFIPKPLRESNPFYKNIVTILGTDK
jgi:hypothetical protein